MIEVYSILEINKKLNRKKLIVREELSFFRLKRVDIHVKI